MKFRSPAWVACGAGAFLAGIVGFLIYLMGSPSVAFLTSKDQADWLRVPSLFYMGPKYAGVNVAYFRADLALPNGWPGGDLQLAALRRGEVWVDEQKIFDTGEDLTRWKKTYQVPLPANLSAGNHRLQIKVSNVLGPPLVRVGCAWLVSDSWACSNDGLHWGPVVAANQPFEPILQNHFVTAGDAFARCGVLLGGLAVVGFFVVYRRRLPISPRGASRWRWALLLAWAVIAFEADTALDGPVGYDIRSHLQYIHYVGENHRLPRAEEGWEYFQAPLYYVVSGVEYAVLQHFHEDPKDTVWWLRLIPLASGMLMLEVVYRTARVVFPDRGDLQLIATAVGGFMPMNLYMAQTLSNEPFAACIAGMAMLLCMQIIKQPASFTYRKLIGLGVVLGLALLSKVTSIFWIVPIEVCVLVAGYRREVNWKRIAGDLAVVPIVALMISGAYLVRNKTTTGHWLVTQTKGQWWQDPGYRTPGALLRFGHVLKGPAFTMNRSVWDSLYGTMWGDQMLSGAGIVDHAEPVNPSQDQLDRLSYLTAVHQVLPYNFWLMAAGQWLALLPMALIIIGAIAGVYLLITVGNRSIDPFPLGISILTLGLFMAAIIFEYMTIPMYGWAKSTYMLSTIPCLSILAASGFDLLGRNRILRAMMSGILFSWAVCAYFTFWVK